MGDGATVRIHLRGRDLRSRFRWGRKRTAVLANAPQGDVAQRATNTWNFRRKWIIRQWTIFRGRHVADTFVEEEETDCKSAADSPAAAAAKGRVRWRTGRTRTCSLASYNFSARRGFMAHCALRHTLTMLSFFGYFFLLTRQRKHWRLMNSLTMADSNTGYITARRCVLLAHNRAQHNVENVISVIFLWTGKNLRTWKCECLKRDLFLESLLSYISYDSPLFVPFFR